VVFQSRGDILGFRTDGDTAIHPLVPDPGNQNVPTLSPDGRWLAYASDESGAYQIYVRPFPDTKAAKRQVSIQSGYAPRWSRDGRELFYFDASQDIWSVSMTPGPVFTPGVPRLLFNAAAYAPLAPNLFELHPDGKRFLFSRIIGSGSAGDVGDELVIVQNFLTELRARVPPGP
jgi:eukaryotic-like serine/threonine-protein kinase